MQTIVVWIKNDLRLEDNPALFSACKAADAVIPVYIWDSKASAPWEPGAATQWWLHHSLTSFSKKLKSMDLSLVICKGNTIDCLKKLMKEAGATQLFFNRSYDALDHSVLKEFDAVAFQSHLLFEPTHILTKAQKPYQVFTPFYRTCQKMEVLDPLPCPPKSRGKKLSSLKVDDLKLLPKIRWDLGFKWEVGEEAARHNLSHFIKAGISKYASKRDFPACLGTSRLSAHLHFGEISPRQVWKAVKHHPAFARQIIWREFAHYLLYHFPKTPLHSLREEFKDFPWKQNNRLLALWKKGMTGYPIVDAGMRQLWQTGWMHNRVRMIVASFLVKDLLIPWQEGAKWFWDTLVDADLANNTLGWQWVAGCGADAAPFFRVFNPTLQGQKFDPEGEYVRQFIPELKNIPTRWIHFPWQAPQNVLDQAKVVLGKDYPQPIVDHEKARQTALDLYRKWNKKQ